jgi:hypothetical protein
MHAYKHIQLSIQSPYQTRLLQMQQEFAYEQELQKSPKIAVFFGDIRDTQ